MTKHFFLLSLMIAAGAASADPLVGGDVEAGQQRAAACAACHGPKGNMESDQFPKLAGQGSPYIYEQLKLFKSGVRDNAIMMGQAAGLSEKDMKNVAAYYAAQQIRPGVASEKIAPAGATLYHGGQPDRNIPACAGCHGPAGVGNAAAKFPRLSGQNPQYVVTQLTAYREGERRGYRNATIMNGVAENLSDADIKALASYVSGLSPATGESGNDHGALMQNVSGPGKAAAGGAGSGASGGSADSGQGAQGDSAEDGSEKADDAAASSDSGGKTADSASGGDQPASGDSEDSAGQKAAAQDSGTDKESSASSAAESDNASDAKTDESSDAEDDKTGAGGENGTASGTATSASESGSDSAAENADQAKEENPEDKNSGNTGASPQ